MKLLILGACGHGQVINEIAHLSGQYNKISFLDDRSENAIGILNDYKKFVDEYHWIEEDEMLDLVAIAQSSPGAIAVNGAIVVGFKLAELPGTLVAILGTIIPPFVILSVIFYFYAAFSSNYIVKTVLDGMQAGVGAVIASVVWDMGADITRQKSVSSMLITAAAFVLSCVCKVNVVYIVLGCIALGTARTLLGRRKAG